MRAYAAGTAIVRAFVAVIGTGRTVGEIVGQAHSACIARVRVVAQSSGRASTGSPSGPRRMRANTSAAHIAGALRTVGSTGRSIGFCRMDAGSIAALIVGAFIAVIGTRGSVDQVIREAHAAAVAGVGVIAQTRCRIPAGASRRLVGMRTNARGAYIVRACVSVFRACGSIGLVRVGARPLRIAHIAGAGIAVVGAGRTGRGIRIRTNLGHPITAVN